MIQAQNLLALVLILRYSDLYIYDIAVTVTSTDDGFELTEWTMRNDPGED